ncbi:MAG: amidohydrolase [Bacteroidota bacterium]|nr:amidohydrolase [Odoribacter sp.]MDP3642240.1 amidohydrolase [Bacteroidota bacterium]
MSRILFLFLFPVLFVLSCNTPKMKVDLIITNALVYMVNDSFTVAESFAVQGGKFLAVGKNEEIAERYSSVNTIDADGKTVVPGFIDAHCHFFGYGMNLMQYADLAGLPDQESIYRKLQEHQAKAGGDWLLGRGWDQNLWPEKEFPDNQRLNEMFPEIPVYLIRIDGHAAWCNAKALELAGITANTKVDGGEVLLENGQTTGVLIDNAMELVSKKIPVPTLELKIKALLAAQQNCMEVGLTSVTDCGLPKEIILLMDSLQKRGLLKMRINAMMEPSEENLEYFMKNGQYVTDHLQVRTIKLYADGALGSRGAYLLGDYSDDPGNRGLLMNKASYFEAICLKAYDAGFQVATHCIGDGANRFILNIYGEFLKGKNDRRWRIEHAQVVHPDDLQFFGKYSVVPSIQATHATSDMLWADERLGAKRINSAYAYQQLLAQNDWLPNGTDFPVEGINPALTFFASVCRKNTDGLPADGFQMENALTREQALRSMTIWAAKAGFEELKKGSIEPGKSADFVVFDTDLMNCKESDILKAKVLKTVLGGEVVYKTGN